MTEPLVIGLHDCKWIKDSNTKMITLNRTSTTGSSAMKLDGVDYQVPAGKKFIILQVSANGYQQYGGVFGIKVYKGATAGTLTTELVAVAAGWAIHTYAISGGSGGNNIQCYIEVEAGQYINSSNLGTQGGGIVTGVETNA